VSDESRDVPGRVDRPETVALEGRRLGYRNAVRIGLAVSFVLHLFVLLVLGHSLRVGSPSAPAVPPSETAINLQGPRSVEIGQVLTPEEAAEQEGRPPPRETPTEQIEPTPRQPAEGAPTPAQPAERRTADEGYLTNAEKLQPKEGDERLYQDVPDDQVPVYLAENPYARYEGEIRARLGIMLDSLNLSEEQRRKALEWLTGDEGEEWGVAEDGIHIGGVVIPIDLGSLLQEEGPNGRESRQQMRDLRDIRYQDLIGESEEIQKERAREMRERTKQQLEQRLQDSLKAAQDSAEADE
jgi:hypothetical protein